MNSFFKYDDVIARAGEKALEAASASFARIDEIRAYNQEKVLAAFIKNSVNESHFTESTGYGYGDRGRDVLDSVLADCVGAEDSLIRHSLTCGTHTLGVALFGMLRPGDTLVVSSLDRLSRNKQDIKSEMEKIREQIQNIE